MADREILWETIKPMFSNKSVKSVNRGKLFLVGNQNILKNDKEIVISFNDIFSNNLKDTGHSLIETKDSSLWKCGNLDYVLTIAFLFFFRSFLFFFMIVSIRMVSIPSSAIESLVAKKNFFEISFLL